MHGSGESVSRLEARRLTRGNRTGDSPAQNLEVLAPDTGLTLRAFPARSARPGAGVYTGVPTGTEELTEPLALPSLIVKVLLTGFQTIVESLPVPFSPKVLVAET